MRNVHTIGILLIMIGLSTSVQSATINELFEEADANGRAQGIVSGRFERNVRSMTDVEGPIQLTVTHAPPIQSCRTYRVIIEMTVKTPLGSQPVQQPLMVPICSDGLPPEGFLPAPAQDLLKENISGIVE